MSRQRRYTGPARFHGFMAISLLAVATYLVVAGEVFPATIVALGAIVAGSHWKAAKSGLLD